jgi:hypothetical protein
LEDQAFEVVERGYGRQHLWIHRQRRRRRRRHGLQYAGSGDAFFLHEIKKKPTALNLDPVEYE